ncbi:hypothetical protein [Tenacibaculum finnmarkense]|uniref:hypothetical protein n=1 Tax=Tenacibaculum finnmarkense TaxID=2781243 RepID=UPI001EFBFAC0|nr:hypothetical protein [Tenacibaculum finnmarkense]MCG8734722.1 hypothetical protein [Tenacibaculum finnmarkense]MCG8860081.1 hypothetical protein [Tenacibaculum finnmarkense]
MQDIKKSISTIIYERTTSPFYGTLIISWIVWNWKIIYLTFFISENKIAKSKIDYIVENYSDTHHIITYPLISTAILITLIPFLANGAYWISLSFSNWKLTKKNLIEKKQLLTVEQSIELREQILKQEERFSKLVNDKNLEIKQLNDIILERNSLKKEIIDDSLKEIKELAERFNNNPTEIKTLNVIIRAIQSNYRQEDNDETVKILSLLESYLIIDKTDSALYKFTKNGKRFLRYINE